MPYPESIPSYVMLKLNFYFPNLSLRHLSYVLGLCFWKLYPKTLTGGDNIIVLHTSRSIKIRRHKKYQLIKSDIV